MSDVFPRPWTRPELEHLLAEARKNYLHNSDRLAEMRKARSPHARYQEMRVCRSLDRIGAYQKLLAHALHNEAERVAA